MTETIATTPAQTDAPAVKAKTKKAKSKASRKTKRPARAKSGKKQSKRTAKPKARKKAAKAKRYSDQRKAELLQKYVELRKAGETTQSAAKKIGVPYITVRSWEKKAGKSRPKHSGPKALNKALKKALKKGKSSQKAAEATAGRGRLSLVTPAGYRIEGISSEQLIQVLKSLR